MTHDLTNSVTVAQHTQSVSLPTLINKAGLVSLTPEAREQLKRQRAQERRAIAQGRKQAEKEARAAKREAKRKAEAARRAELLARKRARLLARRNTPEAIAKCLEKKRKARRIYERARYWRMKKAAREANAKTEAEAKALVLAARTEKRAAQKAKREEKEQRFLRQKRVQALLAKIERRRALILAEGYAMGQEAKLQQYISAGFPAL
jgi:colicin import membrane protein